MGPGNSRKSGDSPKMGHWKKAQENGRIKKLSGSCNFRKDVNNPQNVNNPAKRE